MWIKTQSSNTLIRAEILDLIRMDRGTDGYDITGQSFEPQALNIPLGTYKSKEIAEKALNEIIESMQTREEVVKVPIDWIVNREEKWEVVVKWVTDNIEHFIGDGDFGVIERNDGVVCVKVSELNEVLRNAGLNIRHAISEFADRGYIDTFTRSGKKRYTTRRTVAGIKDVAVYRLKALNVDL